MFRVRFDGSEQHPAPIVFIGLSHANLDALRAESPIRIAAEDPVGLGVEVVIYSGESEVSMASELEREGFIPEGSAQKAAEAIESRRAYIYDRQAREQ